MPDLILPGDDLYAAAAAALAAQRGEFFKFQDVYYRTVRDNDILKFVLIPKTPEKSAFGTKIPKLFGLYSPTMKE